MKCSSGRHEEGSHRKENPPGEELESLLGGCNRQLWELLDVVHWKDYG